MGWFRRLLGRGDADNDGSADGPERDLNDPSVHTPGTYIDSWQNMPGAQADDDERPGVSDLHGRS